MSPAWRPGQQILQQDLWRGELLTSRPVTVVRDDADLLALYTHPNAPYRTRAQGSRRYRLSLAERVEKMMALEPTPFEERRSGAGHVLTLTEPGSYHSVWLFWSADWQLRVRYVNMQAPIRRLPAGILVEDHVLDLQVASDGSWAWKDEDELAALQERGFFSKEQAASIRAEGLRVTRIIERNGSPFCDGWERWRADPEWPVPQMPEGWERASE